MKKLCAVLQRNLRLNGYLFELESAFNRVSVLLCTKTKTLVDKIKKENNRKRRRRKKADTWIKLFLYPAEISHYPYDILTELNEKLDQPGLFGRLLRVEVKKAILRPCLHGVGDPGLVG